MRWLRKRRSEWQKLPLKDKITISISVLALLVSGMTAYFTVARQADDLRVVIERTPAVFLTEKKLSILSDQQLTFINSGNRPVAVTGITLVVSPTGLDKTCVHPDELFSLNYEVEPFVVKSGEITIKKMAFRKGSWWTFEEQFFDVPGGGSAKVSTRPDMNEGDSVNACFKFRLATPDSYSEEVELLLFTHKLKNLGWWFFEESPTPAFKKGEPIVLLRKWGTVLW
jgi:hypothetical protein